MENKSKLTIAHLSVYLPFELKMIFQSRGGRVITLTGVTNQSNGGATITDGYGGIWLDSCGFKPILRALDLNKEITHKGETFIPKRKLTDLGIADVYEFEFNGMDFIYQHETDFVSDGYGNEFHTLWIPVENQYKIYQKCFEWMFDMGGLIAQGLAIDVDSLEDNPYK